MLRAAPNFPLKQLLAHAINQIAQQRGLQLHLVAPIEGGIQAPAAAGAAPVIGFGRAEVFGLDAVNKKTRQVNAGTAEQRDALRIDGGRVDDLGAEMVQSSGGYVFDALAFEKETPAEQKRWLGVVAAAIADAVARTEVRLECKCEVTSGRWPKDVCVAKDTKWKAPIVSVIARFTDPPDLRTADIKRNPKRNTNPTISFPQQKRVGAGARG